MNGEKLPECDVHLGNFLYTNFNKNISDVLIIPITTKPNCFKFECHNNVIKYVNMYGGERIQGYYIIKETITNNLIAIKHSIWKKSTGEIIDITPPITHRNYNIFIETEDYTDLYLI